MKTNALGRGLATLLKEEVAPVIFENDKTALQIDTIVPNSSQPRKIFDQVKIRELADSIISNGLIQPIVVNDDNSGKYKIIAGERRYRACILAGMSEIPVIIKKLTNKEVIEIALIENIQREELTVIEEAEGYDKLIKEFGYSQSDLANSVGKSRSHIANILRLNSLPSEIKEMVNEGKLTMGHARCLVGIEDSIEVANKIIQNDLNVRQAEQLTRRRNNFRVEQEKNISNESNDHQDDYILLGHSLSDKFGVKVTVENSWNGGKIVFQYDSLEELDSILERLN